MAILPAKNFQSKDKIEVTIVSPSHGEAAELLAVAGRIMNESRHVLTQGDEFNITQEMQEKRIRDFSDHPDALLLIAKVNDKVVGWLDFKVGQRRRIAHHGMLAVALIPEYHGKGIGRLLMSELIQWAQQNPRVETLRLEVHATNLGAIALYEKLNFKIEGREVRAIRHDDGTYDDILTMALFV